MYVQERVDEPSSIRPRDSRFLFGGERMKKQGIRDHQRQSAGWLHSGVFIRFIVPFRATGGIRSVLSPFVQGQTNGFVFELCFRISGHWLPAVERVNFALGESTCALCMHRARLHRDPAWVSYLRDIASLEEVIPSPLYCSFSRNKVLNVQRSRVLRSSRDLDSIIGFDASLSMCFDLQRETDLQKSAFTDVHRVLFCVVSFMPDLSFVIQIIGSSKQD